MSQILKENRDREGEDVKVRVDPSIAHPPFVQPPLFSVPLKLHSSPLILYEYTHRVSQLCKRPIQHPFNALRLRFRIGIPDSNRPMLRLDLALIALPLVFPQQAEIANKVPPCGADLTELGRVLDRRIAEGDAAVVHGE